MVIVGSTPELTYKELVKQHKTQQLKFGNVTTFNLDEYWGLDGDHDQSYRYFLNFSVKYALRPLKTPFVIYVVEPGVEGPISCTSSTTPTFVDCDSTS